MDEKRTNPLKDHAWAITVPCAIIIAGNVVYGWLQGAGMTVGPVLDLLSVAALMVLVWLLAATRKKTDGAIKAMRKEAAKAVEAAKDAALLQQEVWPASRSFRAFVKWAVVDSKGHVVVDLIIWNRSPFDWRVEDAAIVGIRAETGGSLLVDRAEARDAILEENATWPAHSPVGVRFRGKLTERPPADAKHWHLYVGLARPNGGEVLLRVKRPGIDDDAASVVLMHPALPSQDDADYHNFQFNFFAAVVKDAAHA